MLGIEAPNVPKWQFLVSHEHPWKTQLFVKGRKLPAAVVWTGMLTNNLSPEQAADNWDLSIDVIREIVDYCESNRVLLEMEAAEEMRRLEQKGIHVEPKAACR